jgi:hypothetical protein
VSLGQLYKLLCDYNFVTNLSLLNVSIPATQSRDKTRKFKFKNPVDWRVSMNVIANVVMHSVDVHKRRPNRWFETCLKTSHFRT